MVGLCSRAGMTYPDQVHRLLNFRAATRQQPLSPLAAIVVIALLSLAPWAAIIAGLAAIWP
jgi:hypothetical protein